MHIPQKTLHRLFLISVWIKGVAGVLETFAGVVVFFVTRGGLEELVIFITAPELAEDPDDWIANYLGRAIQHYSGEAQVFASAYLVIHGLIKVFLVAGLLWGRMWAYPFSLWFLAAFIVYQGYRYNHTHSIWLVLLTIIDLVVGYLIWREYRWRKQGGEVNQY